MTIGKRIEAVLVAIGKTQAELARFLNTNQSTISGWIHDSKVPSADRILPICEFLDVSIEWLLSGVKQTGKQNPAYSARALSLAECYDALDEEEMTVVSSAIIHEERRKNI